MPTKPAIGFNHAVRVVRQLTAILLALVWLPASSHALLEQIGLIHEAHGHGHGHGHHHPELDGDHSHHHHRHAASDAQDGTSQHHQHHQHHQHGSGDHSAADGQCQAAAGKLRPPAPAASAAPAWLVYLSVSHEIDPENHGQKAGLSPPGVAPPELRQEWQFSFRAALPVRAPSILA